MDALAPRADEGRSKLRKASGSRKQASIRGYPNGETHQEEVLVLEAEFIGFKGETGGTETSKYPEEEKEPSIPSVAASERGRA